MPVKEIIHSPAQPLSSQTPVENAKPIQQPEKIEISSPSSSTTQIKEKENIEIPYSEVSSHQDPVSKNNLATIKETLSPNEFKILGPFEASAYLFQKIHKELERERSKLIQHISEYLYETKNERWVKLLLYHAEYEWPSFRLYPNEILWKILQDYHGFFSELGFDNIILNSDEIEQTSHEVKNTIIFKIRANERIKGFSIVAEEKEHERFEYTFCPGPLGEFHLLISKPGKYEIIIRGEYLEKMRMQKLVVSLL